MREWQKGLDLQNPTSTRQLETGEWFPERNEEIVKLRQAGITLKEIAKKFNISPARVRQIEIRQKEKRS